MNSAAAPAGIELTGVSKRFGTAVTALEQVDLHIGDGEFVAVVGPSGCGKSTMMRLIARLSAPSTGSISVFGDVSSVPPSDMGIVFQGHVLLPWRTILDNVLFPADMTGRDRNALKPRAMELLRSVGLQDFGASFPHELSGGMKQRASIARALLLQPRLLLMDEPFGALDAQTRLVMQEMLIDLRRRENTTILFITHDIDEAVFLSDRVFVMTARPGRFKAEIAVPFGADRASDVCRTPEFFAIRSRVYDLLHDEGRAVAERELAAAPHR